MKILTAGQIKNVDAETIKREPVKSIDLMERAANKCFNYIWENFSHNGNIKIFVGPGNNGGDGLAISRMLALEGKKVQVFMLSKPDALSDDASVNYKRLVEQGKAQIAQIADKKISKIDNDD